MHIDHFPSTETFPHFSLNFLYSFSFYLIFWLLIPSEFNCRWLYIHMDLVYLLIGQIAGSLFLVWGPDRKGFKALKESCGPASVLKRVGSWVRSVWVGMVATRFHYFMSGSDNLIWVSSVNEFILKRKDSFLNHSTRNFSVTYSWLLMRNNEGQGPMGQHSKHLD